jgi:PAT family beta-lactamase induction signal transducer AmpG
MTKLLPSLAAYRDRRMLAILAMGFSSGLPLALTGTTLSYWLSTVGVSKRNVGMFALVGASYSLKFLWSPIFDQLIPPLIGRSLGRRRAWMLVTQAGLIGSLLAVGASDPGVEPWWTALAAVFVAFFSASQDIVIDAYRIEILDEESQGAGVSATQLGYRLGMIAAGAGALYLSAALPWFGVYAVMAGLVLVGSITAILSPEPPIQRQPASQLGFAGQLKRAILDPFIEFMTRPNWVAVLLFVMLFKVGVAFASVMATPFYVELGYTAVQLATASKIFGVGATTFGAVAGGWLVIRFGLGRMLMIGGLMQIVSTSIYALQAVTPHTLPMLFATILAENVTDGIGSAALIAYLSSLCSLGFTATQYALLSALAAVGRTLLSSRSGALAEDLGWVGFFLTTSALCLPSLVILAFLLRRGLGVETRESAKQAA